MKVSNWLLRRPRLSGVRNAILGASIPALAARGAIQQTAGNRFAGSQAERRRIRVGQGTGLNLAAPSVARTVNGRPASPTWWVDDVLMNEVTRRVKKIEPSDRESWDNQMHAVRVFDELIANAYRNVILARQAAGAEQRSIQAVP